MKPAERFEQEYDIPNRDVDFMKRLKLGTMFGYIQDISSLHSENIGTGVARLANDFGVAWILMRMRVDILRAPMLYEKIKLSTWPQPAKKALYERDCTISGEHGDIIVRGSAVWILMDLKKRELVKEHLFDYLRNDFPVERALNEKLVRIRMPSEGVSIFEKTVRYTDIDYNGHLNNTKYIDIVMDSIGVDVLRDYEPSSIEVNYSNEMKHGETLLLYKDDTQFESDNIIYAEARSAVDNKNLFTGKVTLRPVDKSAILCP